MRKIFNNGSQETYPKPDNLKHLTKSIQFLSLKELIEKRILVIERKISTEKSCLNNFIFNFFAK